jgi:hypothetical protein
MIDPYGPGKNDPAKVSDDFAKLLNYVYGTEKSIAPAHKENIGCDGANTITISVDRYSVLLRAFFERDVIARMVKMANSSTLDNIALILGITTS